MPSRHPWLLAYVLLSACADCEDAGGPAREQVADGPKGQARVLLPPPVGTPLEPEAMKPWTPDAIAGFTATGPTELRAMPLPNGGKLTSVHREYKMGGQELRIEIRDIQHTPGLGQLVTTQQGQNREANGNIFRGIAVAGHPALLQWHGDSKTAILNVLVSDRLLVNAKLKPVASGDAAVTVLSALALGDLAKLVEPDEGAPAETPQAPPSKDHPASEPRPRTEPAATKDAPAPTPPAAAQ